MGPPKAFISYSWDSEEHKAWVKSLATKLRDHGVNATLDRWAVALGDSLTHFMEIAIRENDFVVIVLTPHYAEKSDKRKGGVGYEGEIMTGEVFSGKDRRRFIPVLRSGTWEKSSPSWLLGKLGADLRGQPYDEEQYQDLLNTILGTREQAPPIGNRAESGVKSRQDYTGTVYPLRGEGTMPPVEVAVKEPIKIVGIIASQVGTPRNDGTQGSALYAVPFRLSRPPSSEWARRFAEVWRSPPSYSPRHRPSIARVEDDRIILDGTTVEEVAEVHRNTLKVVIKKVNHDVEVWERQRQKEAAEKAERIRSHRQSVEDAAKKITFD
jgi:hypothetical protein